MIPIKLNSTTLRVLRRIPLYFVEIQGRQTNVSNTLHIVQSGKNTAFNRGDLSSNLSLFILEERS